ncbi:MAG: beta-galactosidase [Lachnospiraceae bacterium]
MGYQGVKKILYGGDYNPEQWPEEMWAEDIRMMKRAHINEVTLNVFSWAALQPNEDTYCFDKLDKIMNLMRDNGFSVCLATSTGAHPAWMAKRHPDILRTEFDGKKRKFGGRHNSCPNSPTYRYYAEKLAGKLAERYQNFDNIVAWHVSNEFGGECYCENCERAFQKWLKEKYGTIEALNRSFYTAFWGHTFYDWNEVVLPNLLSEHFGFERTMFQGISLDYRRFMSDSILECYELERDAIRRFTPNIPITTNLMGFYKPLDYQKWAKSMDFISWDSYPAPADSAANIAMSHDLMRGIKQQNSFVLMEQTPSVTNWQPYNKLKRPGEMRLMSYEAVAHGADAVQFFQIRRGIGACEKYHGAVIDHAGREDTRVFREVMELGAELEQLGDVFLEARTPSKVAIVFDWDNWWAVEYSAGPSIHMKYLDAVADYYQAAFEQNVAVDFVSVDDELSGYQLVIAPLLYMCKTGYDEKLRNYVKAGGCLITTYFSGIVDEHDLVYAGGYPGPLKDILGIWVEESDALPEGEENSFNLFGSHYPAYVLCDLIHLEGGAQALSVYESDFYQGTPVITKKEFGNGLAYYVGTRSNAAFYRDFLRHLFKKLGIKGSMSVPLGVEAAVRVGEKGSVLFLMNHAERVQGIVLEEDYLDLLSGVEYHAGDGFEMLPKAVRILLKKE